MLAGSSINGKTCLQAHIWGIEEEEEGNCFKSAGEKKNDRWAEVFWVRREIYFSPDCQGEEKGEDNDMRVGVDVDPILCC